MNDFKVCPTLAEATPEDLRKDAEHMRSIAKSTYSAVQSMCYSRLADLAELEATRREGVAK
jgi:hypothetical protein